MVSLRATIGALSALTVALVSTVTLSIALTSSFDALRAIGTRHAAALLQSTSAETAHLFETTTDMALQMDNFTKSQPWGLPSEDPRALDHFRSVMQAAFMRSYPRISSLVLYFRDNSRVLIDGFAEPFRSQGEYVLRTIYATNFTRDYPNQAVWEERLAVSWSSHTVARNVTSAADTVVKTRAETTWDTLHIATYNSFAPAVYPPIALFYGDQLATFVPSGTPMYSAGAPARTRAHVLGYFVATMTLDDLGGFLRRAKSTPGTAAFAYDRGGNIVATSEMAPFMRTLPDSTPVTEGCTATRDYADASDLANPQYVICRDNIARYAFPPLNAFAESHAQQLRPALGTATVERLGLSGETYFVATLRVPLAFRGLEIYLLLLMPEADVIGDVITGRNVAIGVTCGLVVLAAAVNVAIVWLLLAPLGGIAERMLRAANLEDDDDDASVSVMAEVARLQEAYYAMNDELNRIRSYVPQSVLVARKVAAGEDDNVDADLDTGIGGASTTIERRPSDTESNRSVRSTASATRRDSGHELHQQQPQQQRPRVFAKPGGRNSPMVASLRSTSLDHMEELAAVVRNASVVCANVVGLHASAPLKAGGRANQVCEAITSACAVIQEAVAQRHGVLTFHGDRFLATFNTARPCAGHASKAALTAVAVAGNPIGPMSLRIAAGVSTGVCAVGPMGSATMKTLSTVGPAVSNAALLERLTRQHPGVFALASHRTCVDTTTAVGVRFIDYALLHGKVGGRRATAVGQIVPLARNIGHGSQSYHATAENEWMYVLAGAAAPYALYNEAFEALQRDDVVGVLSEFDAAEQRRAGLSTSMDGIIPGLPRQQSGEADAAAAAPSLMGPSCPPRLVEIVRALREIPDGSTSFVVSNLARTVQM